MGQCQSVVETSVVYTPPSYTDEDMRAAVAKGDEEYFQQLLKLLQEDTRFKTHKIISDIIIPMITRSLIDVSYKKEKDLTVIDHLLFDCMVEITLEATHVLYLVHTHDDKMKFMKKLVDNVTYRKDSVQVNSYKILANISNFDCTKLTETTLPAFLNTSMKRSTTSKSSYFAMLILVS
jgi:hypothetical protein